MKTLKKFPEGSEKVIIGLVKKEGIPKFEFLHEYIIIKSTVTLQTAKDYFNSLTHRLKPTFIEFQKNKFRLNESVLEEVLKERKSHEEHE